MLQGLDGAVWQCLFPALLKDQMLPMLGCHHLQTGPLPSLLVCLLSTRSAARAPEDEEGRAELFYALLLQD